MNTHYEKLVSVRGKVAEGELIPEALANKGEE